MRHDAPRPLGGFAQPVPVRRRAEDFDCVKIGEREVFATLAQDALVAAAAAKPRRGHSVPQVILLVPGLVFTLDLGIDVVPDAEHRAGQLVDRLGRILAAFVACMFRHSRASAQKCPLLAGHGKL